MSLEYIYCSPVTQSQPVACYCRYLLMGEHCATLRKDLNSIVVSTSVQPPCWIFAAVYSLQCWWILPSVRIQQLSGRIPPIYLKCVDGGNRVSRQAALVARDHHAIEYMMNRPQAQSELLHKSLVIGAVGAFQLNNYSSLHIIVGVTSMTQTIQLSLHRFNSCYMTDHSSKCKQGAIKHLQ